MFKNLKNRITSDFLLLLMIICLNLTFIVYFVLIAYFNRLSQDDFDFLSALKENSIFEFVNVVYQNHQGRFISFFIQGLKYSFINATSFFHFIPIFHYSIISITLFYGIKRLCSNLSSLLTLNIAVLITSVFVLINFEFSSFFWIASSDFLQFSFPILLYLCLFNKTWNKYITYTLIFLISFCIGGSSEAFSPLVLFLLFVTYIGLYFYAKKKQQKELFSLISNRIIFSFVVIFIGFLIVFIAPGNANRMSTYTQPDSLIAFFTRTIKSFLRFNYLLAYKYPYIFFISFLGCFLGYKYGNKIVTTPISRNIFIISTVILLFVEWISTFPSAYGMSAFGFKRIYAPIIFWILLFCVFWSFVYGNYLSKQKMSIPFFKKQNRGSICVLLSIFIVILFQLNNIRLDIPIAQRYCLADQEREQMMLEHKNSGATDPLYLSPLPPCLVWDCKGYIYSHFTNNKKPSMAIYYANEISTCIEEDSFVGYNNKVLIKYFDLPFNVYLKETSEDEK